MRLPSSVPRHPRSLVPFAFVLLLVPALAHAALVARWTFDEPGGTVAFDASGNGNHATLAGTATRGPGFAGNALLLDGTSGLARVATPTGVPIGNAPRSVTAWVRADAGTADRFHAIVAWGTPLVDGRAFLVERGRNAEPWAQRLTVDGWGSSTPGATTLAAQQWHHVAATFDGSTLKLYVDGVPDGTASRTYATVLDATGLTIGDAPANDGWHGKFAGALDDVRVYDHALAAAEVAVLAGAAKGVVGAWSAEGTANDGVGTHHGTLIGGATFGAGRSGRAFVLDGIDDYVSVPGFGMTGDWTVEAWVRPDFCSDGVHCPIVARGPAGEHAFVLFFLTGHPTMPGWRYLGCVGAGGSCSGAVLLSGADIPPGTWHHVAVTRAGDTYTMYVDGVAHAAQTTPGAPTAYLGGDYRFGSWDYAGGKQTGGRIDEVRVHDRALAPAEVAASAALGQAPVALPFRDEFAGVLRPEWQLARPDAYRMGWTPSALRLHTTATDLWSGTNSLANRPTVRLPDAAGDYELTAKLRFPVPPAEHYQQAGIVLYADANGSPDEDNYLRLMYVNESGRRFEVTHDVDGVANADLPNGPLVDVAAGAPIWLRITSRAGGYRAYYSLDGQAFLPVSDATTAAFNAIRAGRMRHAGVFALHGHGVSATPLEVQFDYVEITRGDCATLPAGLVGWWPGEGSGLDALGRNHALARNGAGHAAGRRGQAFHLDGLDDHFQVPAPDGFPWTGHSRTMAGWIRGPRDLAAQTESGILQYGTAATANMFGLITSANAPGALYLYGHSRDLAGGSLLPPDRWYHVAVTYDGGPAHARLYVDGLPVTPPTYLSLDTVLSPDGFTIGARPGSATWQGLIDEVLLFDRALAADEVLALAQAPSLWCGPRPSTIALDSAPNPSVAGQSVTMTATVSGAFGTPTGSVAFRDGPADVPGCASVPLAGGQAQCTTAALTVGTHPLLARYDGDAIYAPSVGGATQVVTAVAGQPCAGFGDVDSAGNYCSNVEWLANRGITLGCGGGSFCPDVSVSRQEMAAFMNRLGNALTADDVGRVQAPGPLDPGGAPVVCVTAPHPLDAYPARATLTAIFAARSDAALAVTLMPVLSLDDGATWSATLAVPLRATLAAGRWTNARVHGAADLPAGGSARFGLRITGDAAPGGPTLAASECRLRVLVGNRNATYAPFDAR